MLSSARPYILVVMLLVLTGLARLVVEPPAPRRVSLPSVTTLLAGTDWRVESTQVSLWGTTFRQWSLRHARAGSAHLYVGVTGEVQTTLGWSGELAYEGAGYLVQHRMDQTLLLADGRTAPISVVLLQRLTQHVLVAAATVSPDAISAHGTDRFLLTAWDVLRGSAGPYFLVSVTVPVTDAFSEPAMIARGLLARVLPPLQTRLQEATH